MPRRKEFCPFENDFFDVSEFEMVGSTRIHDVEPCHRATDGVLVTRSDDKVTPINKGGLSAPSERQVVE